MPAAAEHLAAVNLFKPLSAEASGSRWRRAPAQHLFAAGEAIVRQDADGDSMFVVMNGQARVVLEPSGQEVAVIPAGGFFGEMSMLTGDRRTATVKAMGDVTVLEISARRISASWRWRNPDLLDHVSTIMSERAHRPRTTRAPRPPSIAAPEAKQNFLARMRRFLIV